MHSVHLVSSHAKQVESLLYCPVKHFSMHLLLESS